MQRTAKAAIIQRRRRRLGNSSKLSRETAARLIPPGPTNGEWTAAEDDVVVTVRVTFWVVEPVATLAGLKLQEDAEGSPLQLRATVLAKDVPCAAVTVNV